MTFGIRFRGFCDASVAEIIVSVFIVEIGIMIGVKVRVKMSIGVTVS